MILLSSIIKQFESSFLARYKSVLLPSHKNALRVMKDCRKESGPQMLARCTNHNCAQQTLIPLLVVIEVALIVKITKDGSGLKIN